MISHPLLLIYYELKDESAVLTHGDPAPWVSALSGSSPDPEDPASALAANPASPE